MLPSTCSPSLANGVTAPQQQELGSKRAARAGTAQRPAASTPCPPAKRMQPLASSQAYAALGKQRLAIYARFERPSTDMPSACVPNAGHALTLFSAPHALQIQSLRRCRVAFVAISCTRALSVQVAQSATRAGKEAASAQARRQITLHSHAQPRAQARRCAARKHATRACAGATLHGCKAEGAAATCEQHGMVGWVRQGGTGICCPYVSSKSLPSPPCFTWQLQAAALLLQAAPAACYSAYPQSLAPTALPLRLLRNPNLLPCSHLVAASRRPGGPAAAAAACPPLLGRQALRNRPCRWRPLPPACRPLSWHWWRPRCSWPWDSSRCCRQP